MFALEEMEVAAYIVERRGETFVFSEINKVAASLWFGRPDATMGETYLRDVFPDPVADRVAESFALCMDESRLLERDSIVPTPHGEITVRTTLFPLAASPNGDRRLLGVVSDVSEERRVGEDLQQANTRLAVALDALGGAAWSFDATRQLIEFSSNAVALVGPLASHPMRVEDWLQLVHPDDKDLTCFDDLLTGYQERQVREFRLQDDAGSMHWVRCHRRAVRSGRLVHGVAGVMVDITAEKERETMLREEASTDPLTGLANRRRLERVLGRALLQADPVSLVMIDVDRFKAFNDHQGHVAGDAALRNLAALFDQLAVMHGGTAARYGGEEFLAVLPGSDEAAAARFGMVLLQKVRALGQEHSSNESGLLTVSAGAATRHGDAVDGPDLIRQADAALYQAKREGRNCFRAAQLKTGLGSCDTAAA